MKNGKIYLQKSLKVLIFFTCFYSLNLKADTFNIIIYPYPPYINIENGKPVGISIDVVKRAFERKGHKVNFTSYPYPRALDQFKKDDNGIIIGALEGIPNNHDHKLFQVSFITYSTTLFYNMKANPEYSKLKSIKDIKGKNIGIIRGAFFHIKHMEDNGAKIVKVTSESQIFPMLKMKRLDFAHFVRLTGVTKITNKNFSEIRPINFNLIKSHGGLVLKQSQRKVKMIFAESIKEMHISGELEKVFNKTLNKYPLIEAKEIMVDKILELDNQKLNSK